MLKLKKPRKSLRGLAWIDALKKALATMYSSVCLTTRKAKNL